MSGLLEGRVAIVTGAGNGIGREHARLFAREGAKVVVNDVEADNARAVAEEVGGVANSDDVAEFDGAGNLVAQAVDTYGRLDAVVNNAGILRDAFLHRMTEQEWDLVLRVHLKGHFSVLRTAVDHWRERAKAGEQVRAAVVNTASASGTFLPNAGQANYGAAKAAIAALTQVAAAELPRIGVRVNGIAPVARTRLTEDVPMIGEMLKAPEQADAFDPFHPRHVSPLVAYLCSEECPVNGKLFAVQGGSISELVPWSVAEAFSTDGDWTWDALASGLGVTAAA